MIRNFKIGAKLALAFGVLLLIFAGVGALSWFNMGEVSREARSLADEYVPEMVVANRVQSTVQELMYEIRGYGYTYDRTFLEAGRRAAESARAALGRRLPSPGSTPPCSPSGRTPPRPCQAWTST